MARTKASAAGVYIPPGGHGRSTGLNPRRHRVNKLTRALLRSMPQRFGPRIKTPLQVLNAWAWVGVKVTRSQQEWDSMMGALDGPSPIPEDVMAELVDAATESMFAYEWPPSEDLESDGDCDDDSSDDWQEGDTLTVVDGLQTWD